MRELRQLDLNLLKALDALLDERSVTRAASRLALTQPAVSAMLTRLRDSFDDPLFVRARHGMVPTVRALALAGPLKQILSDIDALMKPARFDPASSTLNITLAATDYAQRAIVQPLLLDLLRDAPGMRVAVQPVNNARVHEQLEKGEIDLAVLTAETLAPDLHARRLYDERYLCVMRAGHPAAHEPMTLERFCSLPQALVSFSGDPFSGVTDRALAALGKTRHIALSVQSFLFLLSVLRESDLIGLVPARLLRGEAGLASSEAPLAVPGFTKVAAWHERTHHDAAHRWLRERLAAAVS
ncbi:LysR family transcriptional regulator [Entomohabitans teleogrylli]|uniref:LysR family transcriptional regulator n=1 Tax=Entomohabitans teleogrylli TaxID=1384589 RepID=UPI00073D3974|nr:LysR family transcriptional regulator [Entomohabitans teleogrylli]